MQKIKIAKQFCGSKKKIRKMLKEAKMLNEWIEWYNKNRRGW